jgi:hypothetical protein
MSSPFEHYLSVFFVLGLLIVAFSAWQRFNEPSFPNRKTLPRTLVPLRYLFLRPEYQKARFTYLAVSLALYCMLVWPGPTIVPALSIVGAKDFPAEAWALLVALFLVGLVPNATNVKWLTFMDEALRRWVHEWFLVPDGIENTIGVLEDARYEPPQSQLDALPSPLKESLRDDLRRPPNSLRYRWARARMLMESLRQMGAGAVHPLKKAAFEPFQADFEDLRKTYKALDREVEPLRGNRTDEETESVTNSVDELLKQIYAYISWGIRYQADSEQEVDKVLEELGFRVPIVVGHPLSDIVIPGVFLVAVITMAFWLIVDMITREMGWDSPMMSQSVVYALSSGMAASLMYGRGIYIALNQREAQIEQKVWREGSPRCLIPIAIKAGLVTWVVIVCTTVLWQFGDTWHSLSGLALLIKSLASGDLAHGPATADWSFLPINITTSLRWLLAGAVMSAVLATRLSGDVRRVDAHNRVRDALVLGIALGIAAALAQLLQISVADFMFHVQGSLGYVPLVGLAGFACGAVIGFTVPQARRSNLLTPSNPIVARGLHDLLGQAKTTLGTKAGAEDWLFMPRSELGGISPAEAVQYKGLATGVWRLLENDRTRNGEDARTDRTERLTPILIDGKAVNHCVQIENEKAARCGPSRQKKRRDTISTVPVHPS